MRKVRPTPPERRRPSEELQRQLAEKEKTRAEENFETIAFAVDKLFTRVAQDLANKPHMEGESGGRCSLMPCISTWVSGPKATDPQMRQETARVYHRVGDIQQMLGHGPEAEAALKQAVALQKKLGRRVPGVPTYREDLASSRAGPGLPPLLQSAARRKCRAAPPGAGGLAEAGNGFPHGARAISSESPMPIRTWAMPLKIRWGE